MKAKIRRSLLGMLVSPVIRLGQFMARSRGAKWLMRQRAWQFMARLLTVVWCLLASYLGRPVRNAVRSVRTYLGRREVWFWGATWGACAILGWSLLNMSPAKIASTLLTLMFAVILISRIEFGVVAVMAIAASFFYPGVIPKPLTMGGQGFEATESLIVLMLIVLLLRACADRKLGLPRTPMTIPLGLLCLSVLLSVIVSYNKHVGEGSGTFAFSHVYNEARPMFHYLFFFVVAMGIRTERQVKFVVAALAAITAFVGILMVAQYMVGQDTRLFPAPRYQQASVRVEALSKEEEDVTRSLPPGLYAMPLFFIGSILMGYVGKRRRRAAYALATTCIGAGLLMSFTRNLWFLMIFATLLTFLLGGRWFKWRLPAFGVALLVMGILGSAVAVRLAPGSAGEDFTKAVTGRFLSVLDRDKVIASSSMQNRFDENAHAIQNIKKHPILGIGVGTPSHYKTWTRPGTYTHVIYPVFTIHNSYLDMWMRYGLLGVTAFSVLSVMFMVRSYLLFRRTRDPARRALSLALFSGNTVYLGTAAVAMTHIHNVGAICVTALMWGLLEALWRLERQDIAETATSPRAPVLATPCVRGSVPHSGTVPVDRGCVGSA